MIRELLDKLTGRRKSRFGKRVEIDYEIGRASCRERV